MIRSVGCAPAILQAAAGRWMSVSLAEPADPTYAGCRFHTYDDCGATKSCCETCATRYPPSVIWPTASRSNPSLECGLPAPVRNKLDRSVSANEKELGTLARVSRYTGSTGRAAQARGVVAVMGPETTLGCETRWHIRIDNLRPKAVNIEPSQPNYFGGRDDVADRTVSAKSADFCRFCLDNGDPYGNRTRVSAVKGPRPNR